MVDAPPCTVSHSDHILLRENETLSVVNFNDGRTALDFYGPASTYRVTIGARQTRALFGALRLSVAVREGEAQHQG